MPEVNSLWKKGEPMASTVRWHLNALPCTFRVTSQSSLLSSMSFSESRHPDA